MSPAALNEYREISDSCVDLRLRWRSDGLMERERGRAENVLSSAERTLRFMTRRQRRLLVAAAESIAIAEYARLNNEAGSGDRAQKLSDQVQGHLRDALDHLERKTYLTIPELCAYASFKTKNAAYHFLAKHKVAWGAGRVRRRDFDMAHQRAAEERGKRR